MATYKLELGPLDPAPAALPDGTPVGIRPGRDVFVAVGADTLPGTGTNLGTVDHAAGTDSLHKYGANHTAFHHVRDVVYKRLASNPASVTPPAQAVPPVGMYSGPAPGSMWPHGIHNYMDLRIKRHGPIMLSTGITAAPVTMAVAATATIAVKLQPGDVASAAADNEFLSANTAIATVAATGVVTGVAPGTTVVRIAHKYVGHITEANVTVTAATLLAARGASAKEEDEPEEKETSKVAASKAKDEDEDDHKKKSHFSAPSTSSTKK